MFAASVENPLTPNFTAESTLVGNVKGAVQPQLRGRLALTEELDHLQPDSSLSNRGIKPCLPEDETVSILAGGQCG